MKFITTAIIVAYKSDKMIENSIKRIKNDTKIIIIENSENEKLKELEKKYRNVKVFINKNNGFGRAANLGGKLADTKYLLFISPDTIIEKNGVKKIEKEAEKLHNNFECLLPCDIKNSVKNTLKIFKPVGSPLIFIERKKFLKLKGFDKNFFLYYEDIDIQQRILNNNKNIYRVNISFKHLYGSHNKKFNHEISVNRNWHYMWSRFYFLEKNNSYLYALFSTILTCLRSLMRLLFYFFFNKNKYYIYKGRFLGLINSYLKNKSWYRPNIK
jgi:N-acetylglucosaminyl-diphospho-decaprenol L-rhamnosyltransferase